MDLFKSIITGSTKITLGVLTLVTLGLSAYAYVSCPTDSSFIDEFYDIFTVNPHFKTGKKIMDRAIILDLAKPEFIDYKFFKLVTITDKSGERTFFGMFGAWLGEIEYK